MQSLAGSLALPAPLEKSGGNKVEEPDSPSTVTLISFQGPALRPQGGSTLDAETSSA
jgi:hypothetical protein